MKENAGVFRQNSQLRIQNYRVEKFSRKKGQAKKSVWWMPRRQEAKKDAANGETPRGAVSEHGSVDIRMGEPGRGEPLSSLPEYIGQQKPDPVN